MIPVATKAVEIDNLPGEEIAFSIGSPAWVMKSLTKLYSNTILATIREYSTNARDAQDEAGNKDLPIKVTLPTLYDPYFTVEDFGVGMDPATLKTTYTQYGTSTKRGSNDYNGMLGFGSKSALAYADSFTVTSRKDGVETVAVVSRKADYTVSMKIVSVGATPEANGVKVSVPARDYDAFKKIAMDFYRFWEPGTVEVDGEYPEWAVGEKLDDNLYYSKSQGTSYVVMGKVAYRIANPDALFKNRGMNSISFVAYVPNGSVEFTPSREDLEYTDQTKATLYGVIENFEKKILAQAKADIDSATDFFDAYVKYTYWSGKLGKGPFGNLEFKGEKFLDEIKINAYRYRPSEMRYNMYSVSQWQVSSMSQTLIITGMPGGNPSSTHKSRAKKYRDQQGIHAPFILFTPETDIKSVWIEKKRVVSWETVKEATKPPKKPRDPAYDRPKRIKGTFDYYTKDGFVYEKELPDTKELYFISVQDDKSYNVLTVLRLLEHGGTVVLLAANRLNKFKRDNPHVKSFVDEFTPKVNLDGMSLLDKQTKEALAVGGRTRDWINTLPLDKIKDPEFHRIKALLDSHTNEKLKAYDDALSIAAAMQMRYNFKQHNINRDDNSLVEKYPLLASTHPRYGMTPELKEDFVIYINAKFASAKKKGN